MTDQRNAQLDDEQAQRQIEQLIERQGWNETSLVSLAENFISEQELTEAWARFLERVAREENGHHDDESNEV